MGNCHGESEGGIRTELEREWSERSRDMDTFEIPFRNSVRCRPSGNTTSDSATAMMCWQVRWDGGS